MANALSANSPTIANGEYFYNIWKLTRTMMAAGWKYMASGNGNGTYGNATTFLASSYLGGTLTTSVNAAQTISGTSITAFASNLMTITVPNNFFGVGTGATANVQNSNTSVTISNASYMQVGTAVIFTGSSQPTTVYFLGATNADTTTMTLSANFTGTTQNNVAMTLIPSVNGAGTCTTVNGNNSVATTTSLVGVLNINDIIMFSSQPGTFYTVSAVATASITLTGNYTGTGSASAHIAPMSTLNAGCIGQYVTVSGCATSGNNGTFLVTSVTGNTLVVYNPSGASTDANNGAISLAFIKNPALDLWASQGAINLKNVSGGGTGSGTGVTVTPASILPVYSTYGGYPNVFGFASITGLSGFSINASPGRYVTITGSGTSLTYGNYTSSNNGSWRIVAANAAGTAIMVYGPWMGSETSNSSLTVTEQYGGADGSIGAFSTVTTGQSTLINFTTSTFNSFTAADVGRRITVLNAASLANKNTFTIASYVSSNNVLLYNPGGVASDANNGTLQWVEVDPLQQVIPWQFLGSTASSIGGCWGAWLTLQGPTTIKIPIGSNVVTGAFIRGENVTQSSTGAQGELLGYNPDSTGGTGYLVIAPRVVGTGSSGFAGGLYGWNNSTTDTVTGALSGATVTSTAGPPIAYVREMVFWKINANNGNVYYQCVDQNTATESAVTGNSGRFSIMANSLTTVTSQIAPGGAPATSTSVTGYPPMNGFPTVGSLVMLGSSGLPNTTNYMYQLPSNNYYWGAGAGNSAAYWPGGSEFNTSSGKGQLICANCIEQQGVSQDGSWVYAQYGSSTVATGYLGMSLQRCDNQEDGDLDPYVCQVMLNYTISTASRQLANADLTATGGDFFCVGPAATQALGNQSQFRCFRRRGLSGESFYSMNASYLWDVQNAAPVMNSNGGIPDEVATAPNITYVREPLWVTMGSTAGFPRMRKGTPRWMMMTSGVTLNQTTDNLKWVSLSNAFAAIIVGPWDGVTIPTN